MLGQPQPIDLSKPLPSERQAQTDQEQYEKDNTDAEEMGLRSMRVRVNVVLYNRINFNQSSRLGGGILFAYGHCRSGIRHVFLSNEAIGSCIKEHSPPAQ